MVEPTDIRSKLQKYPLISIITPTWQRHDLLFQAIRESVFKQTYPNLEHIIVSDGPDPELAIKLNELYDSELGIVRNDIRTIFYQLGYNTSTHFTDSYCSCPVMAGQILASGDYQTTLADDEWIDPTHIEKLYNLLIDEKVDFTYSRVLLYLKDAMHIQFEIGVCPPVLGQITNFLYGRALLDKGMYRIHSTRANDWDMVQKWLAAGATCAMLNEVTMIHRADN